MITATKPKLTVPGSRVAPVFGRIAQTLNFVSDSISVSSQLFKTYGSVVSLAQGGVLIFTHLTQIVMTATYLYK